MNRLLREPSPDDWLNTLRQQYGRYRRPVHAFGMTTNNELQFLEAYARERFTGCGRIVDLGCWYGATTLSLARGLAANRKAARHRTIEAYDVFKWEAWMDPIAEQVSLPRRYQHGESFYDDVCELTRPYGPLITLCQQDILEYRSPAVPVEFLFIDAMKDWKLAQKIVSEFFPLLRAGEAYVVQQDFAYYFPEMATNHLIMWYLRDHFTWIHHVPGSASVVFACVRSLDPAELPSFVPALFTSEMVDAAYEYSLTCVSAEMRIFVEVAKLNFLIEQGIRDAGDRQMNHVATISGQLHEAMVTEVERVAGIAATRGRLPEGWLDDIRYWVNSIRASRHW